MDDRTYRALRNLTVVTILNSIGIFALGVRVMIR